MPERTTSGIAPKLSKDMRQFKDTMVCEFRRSKQTKGRLPEFILDVAALFENESSTVLRFKRFTIPDVWRVPEWLPSARCRLYQFTVKQGLTTRRNALREQSSRFEPESAKRIGRVV